MKLLFITRKFPPSVGGMENFAHDLYVSLSKEANVSLIKWGGTNKLLPFIIPFFFVLSIFKTFKDKPDIIHIQDGLLSPLGLIISKIFRKPYTVVIHGLDITYKNKLFQLIIPKATAKADRVFCISKAAAEQAIERGVPRHKTVVIPLGASEKHDITRKDAKLFLSGYKDGELKNKKLLLTVGRLVERKGVAWFVSYVLPNIVEYDRGVRYLIVGDGEERENIRQAIHEAGMESYALMLGRVSDEELSALYKGSDIFVMPNIPVEDDMEGFGIVLVEAALCSLPIVASGIEGILDATRDGKSAIHVPAKDSKAFIKNVQVLISNLKNARVFGEKAKEYTVEHYSWSAVAKKYVNEQKKVLTNYK